MLLRNAMLARRSVREMTPAPLRSVLALVGWVTVARAVRVADPLGRTRRVPPSAGALHPVEVVVVAGGRRTPVLLRVDPLSARVQVLSERRPGPAARLLTRLPQLLPRARGTALVLLADRARTAAFYHRPDSLLWRDAGALLASLQLAAGSLGLVACPTGLLGQEVADGLFPGSDRVVAAGSLVVGLSGRETRSAEAAGRAQPKAVS
ncbi:nitroreductase family protein [Falsiroseomonas sp. HW251]|uniref:nitroreductase family protein n=1 Tax=Falsiroseomonas sp. HW251 TaxID=3390998 RepID=UPI003D313696